MSAIRLPALSKLHAQSVVRCECDLVQFQTKKRCRRCREPFEEVETKLKLTPVIEMRERSPLPHFGAPAQEGHQLSALNLTHANGSEIDEQMSMALWLVRVVQGMTQKDVAEKLGVTRTNISKLERGQAIYVRSLERYAGALGLSTYGLLVIAEAIH